MPRRRRHDDHDNHEAWAIPYGDLVTLLLAFFVVMYAMSSVNEGKYRVLSDSLTEAFHGTPRSPQPIEAGGTHLQPVGAAAADAGASHDPLEPADPAYRAGAESADAVAAVADRGIAG